MNSLSYCPMKTLWMFETGGESINHINFHYVVISGSVQIIDLQFPIQSYNDCGIIMPPGCKGTRSVSSSGSDFVKVAATLIGLSAAKRNLSGIGGSSDCEIIFDLYEDCMNKIADDSTYSCDFERKRMEPCGEFKKVPGRQSTVARHRAWVESVERQATAAGFASAHEYLHDKIKSDRSMCHIAYEHYKKCIEKHGPEPFCEIQTFDCPQFKKAP